MSHVAPAERSPSMTTRVTSLRNSTGRSKWASTARFAPKSNAGPADLAPLSVERAHRADRRRARVRARDPHGQRARFIVGAGERERAPAVGHDLDRPSDGREPGRKGACSAELDPVGDPQDVGVRLASEKALDRRQRRRAVGRVGNRRERAQPALDAGLCRAARCPVRPATWRRSRRFDRTAPPPSALSRAKSIRLSHAGAAGKSVVDQNQERPRPGERGEAVPQRLGHGEDDERPDRETQRQDRPGRARRRRLGRIEPDQKPQRREHRSGAGSAA